MICCPKYWYYGLPFQNRSFLDDQYMVREFDCWGGGSEVGPDVIGAGKGEDGVEGTGSLDVREGRDEKRSVNDRRFVWALVSILV